MTYPHWKVGTSASPTIRASVGRSKGREGRVWPVGCEAPHVGASCCGGPEAGNEFQRPGKESRKRRGAGKERRAEGRILIPRVAGKVF